jgi:hypothetical protein
MATPSPSGKKKQAPQPVARRLAEAHNWGWKVARELFPDR